MTVHELKTHPYYFQQVWLGKKTFEIRNPDRKFKKFDILILKEYDKETDKYSGREIHAQIPYIFPQLVKFRLDEHSEYQDGVVMGIWVLKRED